MTRYTVTWKPPAKARLAELWNDNPLIRDDISMAADQIDKTLAIDPEVIGIAQSTYSRRLVELPLEVLFAVSEADRTVRVIYVKFWED